MIQLHQASVGIKFQSSWKKEGGRLKKISQILIDLFSNRADKELDRRR